MNAVTSSTANSGSENTTRITSYNVCYTKLLRYRLLGDHVPPWIAGLVVAAAATAIPVLAVQGVVFSEPLFAVLLVTAFILTVV